MQRNKDLANPRNSDVIASLVTTSNKTTFSVITRVIPSLRTYNGSTSRERLWWAVEWQRRSYAPDSR